jgi:hypothetical protein
VKQEDESGNETELLSSMGICKDVVDFDSDGKADVAVYRENTGVWYIVPSSGGSAYGVGSGGVADDVPLNPIAIAWYYMD